MSERMEDRQLARHAFNVLQEYRHTGLGIRALARELDCKQADVKQCLETTLRYRVWQDASKRWHLKDKEFDLPFSRDDEFETALTNLSLYYRDCINQGTYVEVSVPAAAHHTEVSYVELSRVPLPGGDDAWGRDPDIQEMTDWNHEGQEHRVAWMGYPVMLTQDPQREPGELYVQPLLLWAISPGEHPGEPCRLESHPPIFNGAFLQAVSIDDGPELAREATRLCRELGLDRPSAKRPDLRTLAHELHSRNPHWNWLEPPDPELCGAPALCRQRKEGIYNRCVVVTGERSSFIRGLQQELVKLTRMHESIWRPTVLGHLLEEQEGSAFGQSDQLLELVAMNTEQRKAVERAMSAQASVTTGPPGTGKSQTEVNLMGSVLLAGGSVLLVSKNHKAVRLVEDRFNSTAHRRVLYRHGSHQDKLANLSDYWGDLLKDASNPVYEEEWQAARTEFDRARRGLAHVENRLGDFLSARHRLMRSDEQADEARAVFGESASGLTQGLIEQAQSVRWRLEPVITKAQYGQQPFWRKLLWRWILPARLREVEEATARLRGVAQAFGVELPPVSSEEALEHLAAALDELGARIPLARKILEFRSDLATLKGLSPMEDIAKDKALAGKRLVASSRRLWGLWVRDEPRRLGEEVLQRAREFVSLVMERRARPAAAEDPISSKRVWELYHHLLRKVPCQAVTALSAKSTLPLKEGRFDFLIVDEASQCDIASALPMLFRARHLAVFGDPQQLRHVTSMSPELDDEFMARRGLGQDHAEWKYSTQSLYDLVASRIGYRQVHLLRDHHRCHADIAEFVSREFYDGQLRVATRHSELRRPDGVQAGIVWQHVKGVITRPPGQSGALNHPEAHAVVDYLVDLLLVRKFTGTVGVVTPFRVQAKLLNKLIQAHPGLRAVCDKANLQAHTAHRFQGDERDVIVLSPVIAQGTGKGLLSYLRGTGELFNVAITRARALLHVVGDREMAASCDIGYLCRFVEHVGELERRSATRLELDPATLGPTYPRLSSAERVSHWEKVLYEALYAQGLRPIPRYSVEQFELQFAVFVEGVAVNIEIDLAHDRTHWNHEDCMQTQIRDQRLLAMEWNIRRVLVCELRDDPQACIRELMAWMGGLREQWIGWLLARWSV